MNIYGKPESILAYKGKATLQLKAGSKTLSRRVLHNNGGSALFSFLLACLAGEYADVEKKRPLKIKLFKSDLAGITPRSTPEFKNLTSASNFLAMTAAPTLTDHSVIFHFVIPFSFITSSSVDLICLYGADERDITKYCAYFYITDEEGSVAPLEINKVMNNLSLVLDWELTLTNA